MKKILFFVFLSAGILASVFVVLTGYSSYNAFSTDIGAGIDRFTNIIRNIDVVVKWGFTPPAIMVYGYLAFMLINALSIISLVLMLILSGGRPSKMRKFGTISLWFLISALIFTGAFVYPLIDAGTIGNILDIYNWTFFVPIAASLVLFIVGIFVRRADRIN